LTAAGDRVGPAAVVLEDFAFEGGVERFGQRVISARGASTARRRRDPFPILSWRPGVASSTLRHQQTVLAPALLDVLGI
jgi:hypothetical protein